MPQIAQPKLCFSIPASPNAGFYSQVAMFRLALNALGGIYREADIILSLGADEITPLPDQWKPYYENTIKLNWASTEDYRKHGFVAQANARLQYDYNEYDIVILCDADTILLKPIDDILNKAAQSPAVMGVMAHYHSFVPAAPKSRSFAGVMNNLLKQVIRKQDSQNQTFSPRQVWIKLADQYTGKPINFNHRYALESSNEPSDFTEAPFYLNYGFVVTTPKILETIKDTYLGIEPKLALDNRLRIYVFAGQIALTLSLLKHEVPTLELGLRYNFPNDPRADTLYPKELDDVHLIHYMHIDKFNRHAIFTNENEFNDFLSLNLNGSNKVFQEHIRTLTHGRYPFGLRQYSCDENKTGDAKPSDRKVIVVLGTHPNTINVVSRSLKALGVDFGDHPVTSGKGNYDSEHREDQDLTILNAEILRSLNTNWNLISPIRMEDVDVLRKEGYVQQAARLLHNKTSATRIFGFRDPRIVKLLPFWKEVLAQSGVQASYIVALQNPVGVAKSLAIENGFDYEMSSLLWFESVISSLVGTLTEESVVVDYDHLVRFPESELKRLAHRLQLQIDPMELKNFEEGFLNSKLGPSTNESDDLMREPLIFPLVKEIYLFLVDAATDTINLTDTSVKEKIAQWHVEFSRLMPLIAFLDKIVLRVENQQQQLNKKEARIKSLETEINDNGKSKAWRVATFLRHARVWLFPPKV